MDSLGDLRQTGIGRFLERREPEDSQAASVLTSSSDSVTSVSSVVLPPGRRETIPACQRPFTPAEESETQRHRGDRESTGEERREEESDRPGRERRRGRRMRKVHNLCQS
jgi:hypothetical protein